MSCYMKIQLSKQGRGESVFELLFWKSDFIAILGERFDVWILSVLELATLFCIFQFLAGKKDLCKFLDNVVLNTVLQRYNLVIPFVY